MIQRIQSLYLFVTAMLMGSMLLLPIAEFTANNGDIFTLTAFSLASVTQSESTLWMGILVVVATVLPMVTLFCFKRRMLQVRLCAALVVIILGVAAFVALYYWLSVTNALAEVGVCHKQLGWGAIMPIPSFILTLLAARTIFKDEMLVRSLDRIR